MPSISSTYSPRGGLVAGPFVAVHPRGAVKTGDGERGMGTVGYGTFPQSQPFGEILCRGLTPASNSAARSRFPLPPPSGMGKRGEKKVKLVG